MPTQRDRRILERWNEWLPAVSFQCRGAQHRSLLASFKALHADYLGQLLDAGISMRSIRRNNYDDPRRGTLAFAQIYKVACQAHDERVGRRAGVKRTKEQIDAARHRRAL